MSPHHPINEFYGRVTVFEAFGHVPLESSVTWEQQVCEVKQLVPRTSLLHQFPGIYSRQALTASHKLHPINCPINHIFPSLFGAHYLRSCSASASCFNWDLPGRNQGHVLQDHFVRVNHTWVETNQEIQSKGAFPMWNNTFTPLLARCCSWSGQRGLAPRLCCLAELQGLCCSHLAIPVLLVLRLAGEAAASPSGSVTSWVVHSLTDESW